MCMYLCKENHFCVVRCYHVFFCLNSCYMLTIPIAMSACMQAARVNIDLHLSRINVIVLSIISVTLI